MQQLKNKIEKTVNDGKSVLLFTGDKGSTLLMNIVRDMDVRVVFIDTGYHFNEIISYVESHENRIEIINNSKTSATPGNDMRICCKHRKADALKEYLENINAQYLIVPFRDEEKVNGIEDSYLKWINNIQIIRPLADILECEIWQKIRELSLPFSAIYHKGYTIVDCENCTTRHGRKKPEEAVKAEDLDRETEEKLKALGYM